MRGCVPETRIIEEGYPGGHGEGPMAVLEPLKGCHLTDAGTTKAVSALLLCLQPTKSLIYIKQVRPNL